MIYLAFLNIISLLISKAITTTHIFIKNKSNGINKKSIYLIDSKNASLQILRFTDRERKHKTWLKKRCRKLITCWKRLNFRKGNYINAIDEIGS